MWEKKQKKKTEMPPWKFEFTFDYFSSDRGFDSWIVVNAICWNLPPWLKWVAVEEVVLDDERDADGNKSIAVVVVAAVDEGVGCY